MYLEWCWKALWRKRGGPYLCHRWPLYLSISFSHSVSKQTQKELGKETVVKATWQQQKSPPPSPLELGPLMSQSLTTIGWGKEYPHWCHHGCSCMPQKEPPQQFLQQERIGKGRWQHRKIKVVVGWWWLSLKLTIANWFLSSPKSRLGQPILKDVVNS